MQLKMQLPKPVPPEYCRSSYSEVDSRCSYIRLHATLLVSFSQALRLTAIGHQKSEMVQLQRVAPFFSASFRTSALLGGIPPDSEIDIALARC